MGSVTKTGLCKCTWLLGGTKVWKNGVGSSNQGDWASYSVMDKRERDISRDVYGLRSVSSPSGAISFSSPHRRDNLVFWGFFLHFLPIYFKLHWVNLGL